MELLPTDPYSGPPPRYRPDQTVYYHGTPYTVTAVCGRAPLVGWTYEIDGPGELLRVGEGEISSAPGLTHISQLYGTVQPLPRGRSPLRAAYGAWLNTDPDPPAPSFYQQISSIVRDQMVASMLGVPPNIITGIDSNLAAAQAHQDVYQQLVEQQRAWYLQQMYTALGIPQRSAADIAAALQAAAQTPQSVPPAPRRSRRERRAKHRPWTPPHV